MVARPVGLATAERREKGPPMLVSQTLDIVTSAAILYVVAAGLLIVFGVMKIINFAHGGFLTMGGYSALAVSDLGLNPLLSIPFSFAVGTVAGMAVERLVVRPLYSRPLDAILATWGLGIIIGQVITLIYDRGVHFVQSPISGAVLVLGEEYSRYRLVMVAVAIAFGGALALTLGGSRLGLVPRAVVVTEDSARGPGLDSGLVRFVGL